MRSVRGFAFRHVAGDRWKHDDAPHDEIIFSFRRSMHTCCGSPSRGVSLICRNLGRSDAFSQIARDENAGIRRDSGRTGGARDIYACSPR